LLIKSIATHRAARPGPSRDKKRAAQDDKLNWNAGRRLEPELYGRQFKALQDKREVPADSFRG